MPKEGAMSVPRKDWCFMAFSGRIMRCTRCGEEVTVSLPMKISTYARMAEAFCDAHKDCQE